MEVVAFLRLLWRCRVAVAIGCIVAAALGFMATRGTTSRFGVASMRVLLDTPSSQTVDVTPVDPSLVEWRTGVAADLMATTPARQRIARDMGIGVDEVAVSAPYMSMPIVATPLPEAARYVGAAPQRYQLAIQAIKALPIIEIDASAPTRAAAARLATVASDALKAEFAVKAAPGIEEFVVEDVGPVRASEVVDRPRRLTALVIAGLVLGLWCAGIALVVAIRRARSRPGRSSSSYGSTGDRRDGHLTTAPRRSM
jgi:hypothetical protein